MRITIEQMCRELLEVAIDDDLVALTTDFDEPHPQNRSAGELVGMANMLNSFFLPPGGPDKEKGL